MILEKSVLALLVASGAGAAGTLAAAPHALAVLRRWDLSSGSASQLRLERMSTLVSTGMALLLLVQAPALLLFVAAADRMASHFVGAMCAIGSLKVNPFGFPALITQIAAFFGTLIWLVLNAVDGGCRDYPLTRAKHGVLVALIPLMAASFGLEIAYFSGLDASVITSCCGSLFSSDSSKVANDLASLPVRMAIPIYFVVLATAAAVAAVTAWRGRGGIWLGLAGVVAFPVGLAGIVSFLSLYVYEDPLHHCPFCFLKPEYGYRGYAFYGILFVATAAAVSAAALGLLSPRENASRDLQERVPRATRTLGLVALAGYLSTVAVSGWQVLASGLKLLGDA